MLHTQPLPALSASPWDALLYRGRHRVGYEVRALVVAAAVLCALVSSISVLTIGLAPGGLPAAPAVAHADPVGSSAPSGSVLAR